MAVRKNSPYAPFLKRQMLEIIDSGQLQRITNRYATKANHVCEQSIQKYEGDNGTPLSYKKLLMLFVIIVVGMVMAIFVLMIEILGKKMKQKSEREAKGPVQLKHKTKMLLKTNPDIQRPKMITSSTQTYKNTTSGVC